MRPLLTLAALALTTPAFADPAPANTPKVKAKAAKGTITFDDETIDGHRAVPVAVVLTRDQTIKHELSDTSDAHLLDAAARR